METERKEIENDEKTKERRLVKVRTKIVKNRMTDTSGP